MGQVPVRASYDSTLPHSWREPGGGWTGWRTPEEYPRVIDPASGRLWTANARTLDTETWLAFMGDGGYDLGARAAQIRDDLFALPTATAADMTNIQLDDRALFLTRWRDLLLDLLSASQVRMNPLRTQARDLIEHWSGRAAVDDAGYRIVRAARAQIRKGRLRVAHRASRGNAIRRRSSRRRRSSKVRCGNSSPDVPGILLDPHYDSWDAALLASFDHVLTSLQEECKELRRCTWGEGNVLQMRHPLSAALPFCQPLARHACAGVAGRCSRCRECRALHSARRSGWWCPRVMKRRVPCRCRVGRSITRSRRSTVRATPAWARGEPTPLLPGAAKHTLTLRPAATL
jgi:penicillin amidase